MEWNCEGLRSGRIDFGIAAELFESCCCMSSVRFSQTECRWATRSQNQDRSDVVCLQVAAPSPEGAGRRLQERREARRDEQRHRRVRHRHRRTGAEPGGRAAGGREEGREGIGSSRRNIIQLKPPVGVPTALLLLLVCFACRLLTTAAN